MKIKVVKAHEESWYDIGEEFEINDNETEEGCWMAVCG